MEIIEYNEKYLEDVKDLLVELEEYIFSIDKDNLDQLHPEYRDKMAILDLEEVNNYNVGTTYTYNAKAHLHLSRPKDILVSYNCNDMSMKQNKLDYSIYHPRFLNLKDTSND